MINYHVQHCVCLEQQCIENGENSQPLHRFSSERVKENWPAAEPHGAVLCSADIWEALGKFFQIELNGQACGSLWELISFSNGCLCSRSSGREFVCSDVTWYNIMSVLCFFQCLPRGCIGLMARREMHTKLYLYYSEICNMINLVTGPY